MPITSSTHCSRSSLPVAAMLLAAGRGERMRPLTDRCPKPLLTVRGQPLLQWHLEALARGACDRVVINTAWLGEQISQRFGAAFVPERACAAGEDCALLTPLALHYSHEGRDFGAALETAGGICRALPGLCAPQADPVFWVLAGDVFMPGFHFSRSAVQRFMASDKLAHLWLVPNPVHNPRGDFGLDLTAGQALGWPAGIGLALNLGGGDAQPRYTYSTVGLYRRALFQPPWCNIASGNPQGVKAALAPLLRAAMDRGQVSAEMFQGAWTDVGTPERLAQLNAG